MISCVSTPLRAGLLPLWNPFHVCGVPFLAFPYAGLFYPANLIHLFVDIATAIELVFIFYTLRAGCALAHAGHRGLW